MQGEELAEKTGRSCWGSGRTEDEPQSERDGQEAPVRELGFNNQKVIRDAEDRTPTGAGVMEVRRGDTPSGQGISLNP